MIVMISGGNRLGTTVCLYELGASVALPVLVLTSSTGCESSAPGEKERDLADEWVIPQTTAQVSDLSDQPEKWESVLREHTGIQEVALSYETNNGTAAYSLPL